MTGYLGRLAARARGGPPSPALRPRAEPRFPVGLDSEVGEALVPAKAPPRTLLSSPPPPRDEPAPRARPVPRSREPSSEVEREAPIAGRQPALAPAAPSEARTILSGERGVHIEHRATSAPTERPSERVTERPTRPSAPPARRDEPAPVVPQPWVRPRPEPARQPPQMRAPEPRLREPRVEVRIGRVEVQSHAPRSPQRPPAPAAPPPPADTGFPDIAAARRYVDRLL